MWTTNRTQEGCFRKNNLYQFRTYPALGILDQKIRNKKQLLFERSLKNRMEDSNNLEGSRRVLEGKSKGTRGTAVETLSSEGLQILKAHKGFFLCRFVVPIHLSDQHGNWHAGAIATLIDIVGAAAVSSFSGYGHASVDFNVSFFSTAKTQEEIEIEAKVVGEHGKLIAFVVEIRRKNSGELIAIGKQWTTPKAQLRISSRL